MAITIFEMGHKGMNCFGPQSNYPSYEQRYCFLRSPKRELSAQELAQAWAPAKWLADYEIPFG